MRAPIRRPIESDVERAGWRWPVADSAGMGRVLLASVLDQAKDLHKALGELADLGIHLANADRRGLHLLILDAERELGE